MKRIPEKLLAPAAFLGAALLAFLVAFWASIVVESRSTAAVTSALLNAGMTWATVETDGLQVTLSGTAPNEGARFRAVNIAGGVIDASRVRDLLEVTPLQAIEAPRFSVEMLRNGDGIQLIGLLPAPEMTDGAESAEKTKLIEEASALAAGMQVDDLLETAAFPAPEGWEEALAYGLEALKKLPRSKISVGADAVSITAISDSAAQKRRLEADLRDMKPEGVAVKIEITAPRPVLTPFTLRFVKDGEGARFDACSADTDRARERIITAGVLAGAEGTPGCTVGMGVPSPRWAEAAEAGIKAVNELGAGSVTFSDADVTLLADSSVTQAVFDRVVGDLQAGMPPAFSVKATLAPKAEPGQEGPAEFTAELSEEGLVQLRGRLADELQRNVVDSFAKGEFGAAKTYTATRFDPNLPRGWGIRVLAGLESLSYLAHGSLVVRADTVEVKGVTGSQEARAKIAQILSDKLGQGQKFNVSVTYDEKLDPLAALPTPEECLADVQLALKVAKITFAPGSAEIDGSASKTIDAVAEALTRCPDVAFEIAAHSDSQGSEGGNKALSQARAEAVLLSLQGRRAPVGLIRAVGYGEERPIADNGTEEGREANRRIEITLIGGPAPAAPAEGAVAPPAEASADAAAATEEAGQAEETPANAAAVAVAPAAENPEDAPSVAPASADVKPKARGDRKPD
ncbi:OmpA family protein [Neogemmobacter tilapiae]|uniref:Membrane protein n=1 Tax=Neogemmobacter tilapiae TaxID=875041 RepID=A0A918WIX6_9RHOB|nr:OmpA family protein [Gemmobacter tilapiae]GHC55928.1 membrane protein [Gemmobacter tilapiae]